MNNNVRIQSRSLPIGNIEAVGKQASHPNNNVIMEIFNATLKECHRSFTKKDLHIDSLKEEFLAVQLEKTRVRFGAAISEQFQKDNENKNAGLSFLFAQVTNAIIEKTFHQGSCHSQAAYSLIEFCKKSIFNVSLVNSHTGSEETSHWYLVLFDDFTFKSLATQPSNHPVFFTFKPDDFKKDWIFFDSWSNQLCEWKNFKPANSYTKAIKNAPQVTFKPLIHFFRNEVELIEKIIWCLTEYEKRLVSLKLDNNNTTIKISNLFKSTDEKFKNEIELLTDSSKCMAKMLLTIENYIREFTETLNILQMVVNENNINKTEALLYLTSSFFKQVQITTQWKEYPESKLSKTEYAGHEVLYFTLQSDLSSKAKDFYEYLKNNGANASLKQANNKPSIIVDLTKSTLK
ncbi:MAG: hypothetical protein H0V82_01750 [Candidatus Protochlamydia sp.]|nr:hypothetical protein [Candidatus Protochlamydia sp.]